MTSDEMEIYEAGNNKADERIARMEEIKREQELEERHRLENQAMDEHYTKHPHG